MVAIMYFCQANWRYRLLEYQLANDEIPTTSTSNSANSHSETTYSASFRLMLMDYDQVILRLPGVF